MEKTETEMINAVLAMVLSLTDKQFVSIYLKVGSFSSCSIFVFKDSASVWRVTVFVRTCHRLSLSLSVAKRTDHLDVDLIMLGFGAPSGDAIGGILNMNCE